MPTDSQKGGESREADSLSALSKRANPTDALMVDHRSFQNRDNSSCGLCLWLWGLLVTAQQTDMLHTEGLLCL